MLLMDWFRTGGSLNISYLLTKLNLLAMKLTIVAIIFDGQRKIIMLRKTTIFKVGCMYGEAF